MPDLLEEKYFVASLLAKLDLFTVEDLKKEARNGQVLDAIDTVIEDLLQRACIAESQHETLVFDPKTLDFSPAMKTVYTVIPGQRPVLDKYVEELQTQHFQPDAQGKPRGPHFRIVEGLLENVLTHPDTLQQEKEALTDYIALAQEEEMSEQLDPRQREISEAYIRMLYGEFLALQSLWEDAVLQLLTAGQLFRDYVLEDMSRTTEEQACEIFSATFTRTYIQATESKAPEQIAALRKIQQAAESIKQCIPHDEQTFVAFFPLVEDCLRKIKAFTRTVPSSQSVVSPLSEVNSVIARSQLTNPANVGNRVYTYSQNVGNMTSRVEDHISSIGKNVNERNEAFKQRKEQSLNYTMLHVVRQFYRGVATRWGEYVMKTSLRS